MKSSSVPQHVYEVAEWPHIPALSKPDSGQLLQLLPEELIIK
jgi:hypothetical protein